MAKNTADLEFRKIASDDYDLIVSLTEHEFQRASIDARIETAIGGTPWIRTKASVLRAEIDQNPEGCFAAVLNGKLAGYVTTVINQVASRGTIANLVVSSECQGMGIGRKLLQHALDHFRKLGLHQAKIETLADNEAGGHLYPSLGFHEVARQIHYVMPLKSESKT